MEKIYQQVAEEIINADRILFITGAGISADSGLPTYRGIGGLYDSNDTEEGIPIEEAISGFMIQKRPDLTWKYLWQIGKACAHAHPNDAHKIITKIQKHRPDTWVLTQNIDNLHNLAGNENLIEIHGNAFEMYCMDCLAYFDSKQVISNYKDKIELPPKCPKCGGIIRPKVTLFGEMLPEKAINQYYELLDSKLDIVISIGTSSQFPYIQEPVMFSARYDIPTVEINPDETSISSIVKYKISEGAADAMRKLWHHLEILQDDRRVQMRLAEVFKHANFES